MRVIDALSDADVNTYSNAVDGLLDAETDELDDIISTLQNINEHLKTHSMNESHF